MPILHYETRIGRDGSITLPLLPEYCNHKIVVVVEEERSAKSMQDFIDHFTSGPPSDISDEEIEKAKEDYLMEKYG